MSEPPRTLGRWGVLSVLMALAFLNYLDRNLVFPLLTLIGHDLRLDEAQLGALATGFHVVYALSAPLLGHVADRITRRLIILASVTGWSVVTALSGLSGGFVSLLTFRSLTGLGEGGYFPTAISLIGDLFDARERGRVIALHGVCATLGGSAGYALGGVLGEAFGWRVPFLMAVVPGLVLAIVVYRWFPEPPRGRCERSEEAAAAADRPSYLSTVGSGPVVLISLAAATSAFGMNGLNTFFPKYLHEHHHVSMGNAGLATGLFYAATLLGQLGGGALSDRLSGSPSGRAGRSGVGGSSTAVRPLLVGLAFILAAPAALCVSVSEAVTVVLVAYGVTQLARGFAEPNLYGTILDVVPPLGRGAAQGFLLMLTFVGASASPLVVGMIIGRHGYGTAFAVIGAMLALSAALASGLAFGLWRRTPRTAGS